MLTMIWSLSRPAISVTKNIVILKPLFMRSACAGPTASIHLFRSVTIAYTLTKSSFSTQKKICFYPSVEYFFATLILEFFFHLFIRVFQLCYGADVKTLRIVGLLLQYSSYL